MMALVVDEVYGNMEGNTVMDGTNPQSLAQERDDHLSLKISTFFIYFTSLGI